MLNKLRSKRMERNGYSREDLWSGHRQEELTKAIAALGNGDVLLVTRLDRLARSTRDLLNILDQICRQELSSVPLPTLGPIHPPCMEN